MNTTLNISICTTLAPCQITIEPILIRMNTVRDIKNNCYMWTPDTNYKVSYSSKDELNMHIISFLHNHGLIYVEKVELFSWVTKRHLDAIVASLDSLRLIRR